MQRNWLALLSVFTSIVLLVSLVTPQVALAQDETPPPDSAPAQTTDETTPGDAAPIEEDTPATVDKPVVTEEPVVTDEPAATEEAVAPTYVPAEEPAAQQPSVAEILEQVPDGTVVVVLDTAGQPEPLASQAAAQTIVNGDPMWCPVGVLPGGAGCTISFPSFTALIAELTNFSGSDVGAGTIYIDVDYDATDLLHPDNGADIIFNYHNNQLSDLVFQGGWSFVSNSVVGTSNLSGIGSLQFWDWGYVGGPVSLMLRDIVLNGGDGLYIGDHSPSANFNAPVTLENVSVTGANGVPFLDPLGNPVTDSAGTYIQTTGAVTITDSNFSNNLGDGLEVFSGGDITLNQVIAADNDGNGAGLDNSQGTGDVTVTNSNFGKDPNFDPLDLLPDYFGNGADGLDVLSSGNITLSNVTAHDNDGVGANLESCGCLGAGDVNIFNSAFGLNGDTGIIIDSGGNVSLNNISSGNNLAGGIAISSGGDVSVNHVRSINNEGFGILIENDGNATLNDTGAYDNTDAGALVNSLGSITVTGSSFANCYVPVSCGTQQIGGIFTSEEGTINIQNSYFVGNDSVGLVADAAGDITLNNVTADENGLAGAVIFTPGNVKVCGGSYSNNDRFGFTGTAPTIFMSEQTLITGNGDLPMDLGPGTTVVMYDCSSKESGNYKLVNVSDGQSVEIDCEEGLAGIELHLPSGDNLIVPCPMRGPASLSGLAFDQLPAGLPEGFTFVSALEARAARDGLTVSFKMPSPDVEYTILRWNGETWIELEGVTTMDGMFAVTPVSPGIYALATR
jgi:hypothetical protein